ncbi:hypothetical protein [Rubritalea tangerina]|uniref:Uncharacterized protein n=1 Tax=Rubritalea tangerina TaxID=430798 RepID=A0ABW4Z805_9BACT
MKQSDLEELIDCLPSGRSLYTYGKDWYAIELLKYQITQPTRIQQLRESRFGKLMQKPKVRQWLGALGGSTIAPQDINLIYPEEAETFRLAVDSFDGWIQTTRKNKQCWNLVLQLNLNESDARFLDQYNVLRENDPFEWLCHPVSRSRHRTLAWARIDLDWESGEVLIEEIQNDRIREAKSLLHSAKKHGDGQTFKRWGTEYPVKFFEEYWNKHIQPLSRFWDEAMLSATLKFIREELGLRSIFYHTPLSGSAYKGESAQDAPKSIYTKLPQKFCFELTDQRPCFAPKVHRKIPHAHFLHLQL